jgi:peroxiredoxin
MLIPHERSLVEQYAKRPFVVLGVNTDPSRALLRRTQEKEHLPWRSWWDGPSGPIALRWQVDALPTLFLIDHKGVIREHFEGAPPAKELDRLIEALVKEAEANRASS